MMFSIKRMIFTSHSFTLILLPLFSMFASFDPVAIDQACADLCNREKPFADSLLGEKRPVPGVDFFHALHPDTNWEAGIEQAEKIGLGSKAYELMEMA